MNQSVNFCIRTLKSAIADDRSAKREALQCGLDATQPLTLVRLNELCALGERMRKTLKRRELAGKALASALSR